MDSLELYNSNIICKFFIDIKNEWLEKNFKILHVVADCWDDGCNNPEHL